MDGGVPSPLCFVELGETLGKGLSSGALVWALEQGVRAPERVPAGLHVASAGLSEAWGAARAQRGGEGGGALQPGDRGWAGRSDSLAQGREGNPRRRTGFQVSLPGPGPRRRR